MEVKLTKVKRCLIGVVHETCRTSCKSESFAKDIFQRDPKDCPAADIYLAFFLSEPVAFRRVYGLESYSRTSGESNRHRKSVSTTRVMPYKLHHEDDLPTSTWQGFLARRTRNWDADSACGIRKKEAFHWWLDCGT